MSRAGAVGWPRGTSRGAMSFRGPSLISRPPAPQRGLSVPQCILGRPIIHHCHVPRETDGSTESGEQHALIRKKCLFIFIRSYQLNPHVHKCFQEGKITVKKTQKGHSKQRYCGLRRAL